MSERCFYCERTAEYFCDFVLESGFYHKELVEAIQGGREVPNELFVRAMLAPDEVMVQTCDRPLCEVHRKHVGNTFYDGDKKHTFVDSRDLCPGHVNVPGGYKPKFERPCGGGRAA
jgi:hypothetical protein